MLKIKHIKTIEVSDWNKLVKETYNRPYNFQQQGGCQPRGFVDLTIPCESMDDEMNDDIPEVINGETMGVKFKKWLERNPNQPVDGRTDWGIELWWDRNFYPDIYTLANDLHSKGIIEAGEYTIKIDW